MVRQEGLSVEVIGFREFDVLKVLVRPGTERSLEERVLVKRDAVAIDLVISGNDFLDVLFSGFGRSDLMVVREGGSFPYGDEYASLVVRIDWYVVGCDAD